MVSFLLAVMMLVTLTACGAKEVVIDYPDETAFEAALNEGEDLTGKTVTITVAVLVPDSAFGYNIQAGEHLNFCSAENPNVKEGETINVKVVEVVSMLGSYIISYEKI